MGKEYGGGGRVQRVSQELQRKLATILQYEMKDPRMGMITISGIEVSRDLAYAKVFITFLNNNQEKIHSGIRILQNASGYVRNVLGKMISLRVVPELKFIYDPSLIEGIRMTDLIKQVMYNDHLYRKERGLENKKIDVQNKSSLW